MSLGTVTMGRKIIPQRYCILVRVLPLAGSGTIHYSSGYFKSEKEFKKDLRISPE